MPTQTHLTNDMERKLDAASSLEEDDAVKVVMEVARSWPEKFSDNDAARFAVLRRAAFHYALTYEGDWEFMVSMRQAAEKGFMSNGQIRGVLNCIRAQSQRAAEFENHAPVQMSLENASPQVHDGIFTVVDPETDDKVTIRLKTNRSGYMKNLPEGTQIAEYQYGPDNTTDYAGFAFVMPGRNVRIWSRFTGESRIANSLRKLMTFDQEEVLRAGEAYAMESGNCSICGRTLTVPVSLNRGVGPICWARLNGEDVEGEDM